MKISIPDAIRVGRTADHKGNEVAALEILGQQVLLAPAGVLDKLDEEDWAAIFGHRLARVLAIALLSGGGLEDWTIESPTGRDVYKLGPEE